MNSSTGAIFTRLQKRRINYADIKQIATFGTPQWSLRFSQHFDNGSIRKAFKEIDKAKKALEEGRNLFPPDARDQTANYLRALELVVTNTWLEINSLPSVKWRVNLLYAVPDFDSPSEDDGQIFLVAIHRQTKERRRVRIEAQSFVQDMRKTVETAFGEMSITEQLQDQAILLTSGRRNHHAWPIYTRLVIPALYEYMLPFYGAKAHHSQQLDGDVPRRKALYPKQLFKDMLLILDMEHPDDFSGCSVAKLKAIVQTYHRQTATQYENGENPPLQKN